MATVTSLGFNITAKWDGAGLKQAQAQLDSLKKTLNSIDGQSLKIGVDVDDSAARSKLESLQTLIKNQEVTVQVTADTTTAMAELEALEEKLERVAATHATATASVNVNSGQLDEVQAHLTQFSATHATATANVNASSGQLNSIQASLGRFGTTRAVAQAVVNADPGRLNEITAQLGQFGAIHSTASATVNANSGNLDRLQAQLALFGATHVTATADVDVDSAHMHLVSLENDIGGSVRAMGTMAGATVVSSQALAGMGSAAGGAGSSIGGVSSAAGSGAGAFSSFGSAILLATAAAAAFVALAPIMASSIVLIPTAFVGVAALLIGTNKELQKSFQETFQTTVKTVLPLAMPLITALQKGLEQVNGWLKQMGPAIRAAFSAAAPLITPMLQVIEKLVAAALPGLTAAMRNMQPLFAGLGQGATLLGGALGKAADILSRIPGLGQAMSGIMGALGLVIVAFANAIAQVVAVDHGQLLITLLKALALIIQALTPILVILTPVFIMLAQSIAFSATVLIAVENGFKAFFQLLQGGGPIMAAFKVAWDTVWNALKIATLATWNALQVAWSATVSGLSIAWTAVSGALVVAWNAVWNGLKVAAQAVWTALQVAWSAFVNGLSIAWTTVSGALVAAWTTVWNALKTAADAVWSAITVAWNAFVNGLATAWTTVSTALTTAWNAVWNGLMTAAQVVWNAITTAWNAFVNGLVTAFNTVSTTLQNAWSTLWNFLTQTLTGWISSTISAIAGWVSNTVSAFANWTVQTGNLIVSWVSTFISRIASWAADVWNAIKTWVSNTVATIGSWTVQTGNLVVSWVSTFISRITSWASSVWNTIKGWVTNTVSSIASWTVQTGNLVVSWISTFESRVITWKNNVVNAFESWKNSVVSKVKDAVSLMGKEWGKIEDAFKKPVHYVIDTVINKGIIGAANWVIDKLGGGGSAIKGVPVPFASGGHVQGPGTATSDSIPAMLSNGEYVLRASAVDRIGVDKLNQINSGGAGFTRLVDAHDSPQMMNALVTGLFAGFAGGGSANPGPAVGHHGGELPGSQGGTNGDSAAFNLADVKPDSIEKTKNKDYGAIWGNGNALLNIIASLIQAHGGTAAKMLDGILNGAGGLLNKIGGIVGLDHIGDFLKGHPAEKTISAIASVFGFVDKKVIDPIVDKMFDFIGNKVDGQVPFMSGGGAAQTIGKVGTKMALKQVLGGGFIRKAMVSFMVNMVEKAATAEAVAGAKPVKAWAPLVMQALAMEGLPSSWLPGILSMMNQESGGNPNAINRTDSNARAGHPSQGLMQTIPSTFLAYHWPGTSFNILDPLANIAAALNYIKHVYGYPPGSPYASGTNSATPGVHLVGEEGPEMVMFGGGETVKTASDTADMLSSKSGSTGAPAGADINAQKLAENLAVWKKYMQQIKSTSDATWNGVKSTADSDWSGMTSAAGPFASGLAKTFNDAGTNIVSTAKTTWDSTRTLAAASWDQTKNSGVDFTTNLTKSFTDASTAINAKWKNDLADNKDAATKSWDDQKVEATQFSTDLQKTYSDMSTAVGTTWKNTLTTATTDTTKYWTDTKTQYTQGVSDLNTGFVQPVTTMMDTDLPNAFNASVTAIGTGWDNLKTAVREPVAAVVDVVFNQGIVAMWNSIAGTFDAPTLDTFTMPAYATGGPVQGAGTGTSDSITARLSNGEHVWTAAEVSAAGGHGRVAAMRSAVMGGAGVRQMGTNGRFALGGGVTDTTGTVGAPQGGTSATQTGDVPTGSDALTAAGAAALGSIGAISNPFITAAGQAGKDAIAALMPNDSAYKTLLNNMVDQMVGTVTSYITANDVAPTMGGANDAAAQQWADAQVGKPYALGGNFGATFDCSQYMSGIARAILGETPAPWFTTFAFSGDTAPAGFERELEAPFMIGITNVGVGHTAGTLNGTNYEATPPAVRSGPSARGYNDSMFQDWYGFRPSIEAAVGAAVTDSNHLAIIDAAMAAAGVPPPDSQAAWESGMNLIITNESAWNPNAINNYDINAQNGVPSQGLAQVIPPTFSAYHVAGTSDNILDPIANVAAAINYIVSVYGSINNVPGVASVNAGGGYLPYYAGTRGAQAGWHTVGERGPEWVKFRGGEEVLPNGQLPPVNGGGNGDTHISVPITVNGNMDDATYKRVENELVPKIRMMLQQRRGK